MSLATSDKRSVYELSQLAWTLYKLPAGEYEISQLESLESYNPAQVPGTVPITVANPAPDCWQPQLDYHDFNWVYQAFIDKSVIESINLPNLVFEGLATLCDVWVNGELQLTTDNMFRQYELDLTPFQQDTIDLKLVFRSVNNFLQQRRPRPRWKTKLVDNQQMRWVRATVLGHVDVWTPPIKAVGPWRPIRIESQPSFKTKKLTISPAVNDTVPVLNIDLEITELSPEVDYKVIVVIDGNSHEITIPPQNNESSIALFQSLELPNLQLWYPHTHGVPHTYEYQLQVVGGEDSIILKQGTIGFKQSRFELTHSESALSINNENVFCRGTCWTVSDYLSLDAPKAQLEKHLRLLQSAGINLIRVGGTMVYESEDFYSLCDQLGLMVWQDFMFASMDYPFEDENFANNARQEVSQQIERLSSHPCIAVWCGNTDVEAQAAMYGFPEEMSKPEFFERWIPEQLQERAISTPYLSSSPQGGVMPFHLDQGVAHFWGVGAYMHPPETSSMERVKFCSEGMGLSHIPEDSSIQQWLGKSVQFQYSNEWEARIPRDLGAGWCFEDIRNFYLNSLFNVDATVLKRTAPEQFALLSRVTTGEVIAKVFKHWRSNQSQCNGGLIWFNRDFWPCAGFGIIDSFDMPKASYFILKRLWQPTQVILQNIGLDGCEINLITEKESFEGNLELSLLKFDGTLVATSSKELSLASHHQRTETVEGMLGHFVDAGYAYRFGQPQFDFIHVSLKHNGGNLVSEDFEFSSQSLAPSAENADVKIEIGAHDDEHSSIRIQSDQFLQYVSIKINGFIAEDNYFHLRPNQIKIVKLSNLGNAVTKLRGSLECANRASGLKFSLKINDV